MTTENVALLFTDMVGSTALASSLAPDAADELRRDHFSILRQAVAEADGIEVKNLGDGVMVVFGSASAALSCAVAMQQGTERDNRARQQTVELRVGLSGGEVTREGDDYFGDPVIEAARLCASCNGGQILAADVVRLMAGRRSQHECAPIGALELKGLPDRVDTVEVRWAPLGASDADVSVPLPGRLAFVPASGVVGRETEIATMTDAMKRVTTGEGREVVLVSGEAGLGKTTLVGEVARPAFADGACVLFGHCEEDLATPYQLFAEALGHYVTHANDAELRVHVDAYGPELARLVPQLVSRIPDLPPSKATDTDTERFLLFAAVVGLLVEVSREQPVVLVLDDLQWADKASLQLLRHLVAAEQPMRVLVLGTFRDSELSRSHPFVETLAALHRLRGVSRIELAGLDDTGVISLMEAAAGHSLAGTAIDLAHAVYRETDGNPFFVAEVLRHLIETGKIYQDAAGHWVADDSLEQMALPESVRVVIGARVGRLGPDTERVLTLAAVIGRDFDLALLARATQMSEDELLDILDAAAAASLVREVADTGRYSFAHALIQHTLYEELGHNRRARAHRQVAEALEDLCGDRPALRVGELARHWFSATQPIDLDKAIGYSRQAGDAALAALAPADAHRYYQQALDLAAQADQADALVGVDLRIGLGTAQRQTGDAAFRETLLDAARRARDLNATDRLVAAALANDRGWATSSGQIDADKVEILETAVDRLAAGHPQRSLVVAMLCQELMYGSPLERRQALADEAVTLARRSGDDATIVRVLNAVMHPLGIPHLLEQSLRWSDEALQRAEQLGDPVLLFWTLAYRACYVPIVGDLAELNRCLSVAETLAEQLDQPILRWPNTLERAAAAQMAGDVDRSEELANRALQIGTDCGQPDAALIWASQFGAVALQRGDVANLIEPFEQFLADVPGIPSFAALLAVTYLTEGRTEDARRALEPLVESEFDLPLDFSWFGGTANCAYVVSALHDATSAGLLLERLTPFAHLVPYAGIQGTAPVSYYLGGLATALGRYDEADAYYAQAAAFTEQMGTKYFAAETDLDWAKMLLERNAPADSARARELLVKTQAAAAAQGYGYVERRAIEALQHVE